MEIKTKKREITGGNPVIASLKALADPRKVTKMLKRSGLTDQEQLSTPMKVIHVRDGHACVKHPDKPMSFIVKASYLDHAPADHQ